MIAVSQPTSAAEVFANAAAVRKRLFAPQAKPRAKEGANPVLMLVHSAEAAPEPRLWTEQQDCHVAAWLEWNGNQPKAFLKMKCREIGVSFEGMISTMRSRKREVVKPRQFLMCEVKKAFPNMSLPAMGRLFGGFDHTTVLHALRNGNVDMAEIKRLKRTAESLSPDIYRMLQAGKKYSQISAELKISRTSIGSVVRSHGWQWARSTLRISEFTDEIISRVLNGETSSKIARDLGLYRESVAAFARKAGVMPPAKKRLAALHSETIKTMTMAGASAGEIGEAIGLHRSCVSKFLKRKGWKR
jgi:uncharacterized protein YerC